MANSTGKTDAVLSSSEIVQFDLTADDDGDILTSDFFDTSILVSLFEERRASASEVPDSSLRRGWIGNESTPDFERGSKLWLYEQARITLDTINGVNTAASDGLQWLVDDDFAVTISTDVVVNNTGSLRLSVVIQRPNSQVEERFFDLWDNSGVTEL